MLMVSMLPVLLVLFFMYKREVIRHRMKEELEKQSLHTVTIKKSDVIWIKPEKEILVHGRMFDIKTSETKNGHTTFKGLFDEEETALKQLLDENWGKKSTDNTNVITRLFQLLKGFFNEKDMEYVCFVNTNSYYEYPNSELPSSYITIPTPPPQT